MTEIPGQLSIGEELELDRWYDEHQAKLDDLDDEDFDGPIVAPGEEVTDGGEAQHLGGVEPLGRIGESSRWMG